MHASRPSLCSRIAARIPAAGRLFLSVVLAGTALSLAAKAGASPAGPRDSAAVDSSHPAPKTGDPAPDFTLPYATADTILFQGEPLAEAVKHGPVLLAFYPADWSPGCTREVCTFRDGIADLANLKVTVWAISGDQPFAHRAWAREQKLPFRLLSDVKHEVAGEYGSFNPKSGFNQRTVFVVGSDGRIAYENTAYSVKDQTDYEALKKAIAGVH